MTRSRVLPVGTVGQVCSHALSSAGGTGSYTYSTTSRLAAGLTFSAGGVIFGRPTVKGTTYVAVKVTDSAGRLATRTYTLKVA